MDNMLNILWFIFVGIVIFCILTGWLAEHVMFNPGGMVDRLISSKKK